MPVPALRALGVLVCLAAAAAALLAYRSERRVDELEQLGFVTLGFEPDDPRASRARRDARDVADSARLLNPDTGIEVQLALFLEPDQREAEALMQKATSSEPENVFLWISLAKMRESDGDLAGARRAFARAVELDPRLERR
jgi:Flp pilus assembly protein TadD